MAGFRRIPDTEPDIRSIPSMENGITPNLKYSLFDSKPFDLAQLRPYEIFDKTNMINTKFMTHALSA